MTPTVRTAGSTAKLCHSSRSSPARRTSSTTIASAARRISTRSGVDLADDPHGEAGPGERLAPHDLLGQAELGADGAHLVLEQRAQRLDQVEGEVVGEPADVVVALDVRGVAGARLDDVGVQRALHQEPRASPSPPESRATSSKTRMNSSPIRLRLTSGSSTPRSAVEEPVSGLHVDELDVELAAERLLDLLALARRA